MKTKIMDYLKFVYNFSEWKWGKAGHLVVGLSITAAFVAIAVWAPGIVKLFGVGALALIHWGHWRNFNGRQG